MAKKSANVSLFQNVYLLYFLFIATIVHLGYFIVIKETRSLVLFSLVVLFVYLVNPNMILVLGISLIFVDMLYLVQSTQEGLIGTGELKFFPEDKNGNIPGIDCSYGDPSCNEITSKEMNTKGMNTKNTGNMNTKDNFETTNEKAVNPLVNVAKQILQSVEASDPTKVGFTDNTTLTDVEASSDNLKQMLEKVKKLSPELLESLKMLNSIDIGEVNKLLNLLTNKSNTTSN